MWSGQYSRVKKQSLSGNKGPVSKSETRQEILERTRRERAERMQSRREEEAAVIVQKMWRAWMARRVARERWALELSASLSTASPIGISAPGALPVPSSDAGSMRRLQLLIAATDSDTMADVMLLAREVKALLDGHVLDEMLMRVVGAIHNARDIWQCGDEACIGWYVVIRDLFQLSAQCLAAHAEKFMELRGMTLIDLETRSHDTSHGVGEIWIAHVLVTFVLKVLRTSKAAFFDVSLQKVCLRRVEWRCRNFPHEETMGEANTTWTKAMGSCLVQDMVHLVDVLVPQEGRGEGGQSRACVGETLLTAMVVCVFSSSSGVGLNHGQACDMKDRMNFAVLEVVMGVGSMFHRFPSMVPLAGKIWASAMAIIGHAMDFKDADAPVARRVATQTATLECVVPGDAMEPLLVNLVHSLESMHAQGRLANASRDSLLNFMALVELVLAEEPQSTSAARASPWHVSGEAFVHPLAEANVMVIMATTLLSGRREDSLQIQRPAEDHALDGVVMTQMLCSFVYRLLGYCRKSPTVHTKIVLTLAVKANMAGLLWKAWLKDLDVSCLRAGSVGGPTGLAPNGDHLRPLMPTMILFCEMFAMSLNVLGDDGFYERGIPLPVDEVYKRQDGATSVLSLLKVLLWRIVWHEKAHSDLSLRFLKTGGKLLTLLHDRNGRRPFAPHDAFYATSLPRESFHAAAVAAIGRGDIEKMHVEMSGVDHLDESDDEMNDTNDLEEINESMNSAQRMGFDAMDVDGATGKRVGVSQSTFRRVVDVLQYAYPLVPFLERVRVFQSIVEAERVTIGDRESISGVLFGGLSRERFVNVHRGRVLEDAYDVLGQRMSSVDVKKRIRISFVNEFGEQEAGIDGGGVFKEFLESVVRESVAADKGLFLSTTDNKLYPAPTASLTREQLNLIEFVGMMVGKALWEGVLLDIPLASFFLKKIRGASIGVDDLPSLDPEMARNLSYLVHNPESVADMGLTFSISTVSSSRTTTDVELVPGGKAIPVTAANVAHFIHRVANFKLNEQIKTSCDAFLKGFHAIVPKEWVFSFNDLELQMLIGGAEGDTRMDLVDMQRHTVYTGGYDAHHQTILNLWCVLDGLTNAELADFLRFVTSCPRPPILGFGSLHPPLTIQLVHSEDRLPTAATCVNLLKLPSYGSLDVLREKLLYAIKSNAGFDLS